MKADKDVMCIDDYPVPETKVCGYCFKEFELEVKCCLNFFSLLCLLLRLSVGVQQT